MMKKFSLVTLAVTAMFVFTVGVAMAATPGIQIAWNQGFEQDTAGWSDSSNDWFGTIERVASGTNGIASASGGWHATVIQGPMDENADPIVNTAAFSRFDGYRDVWPGDWVAEIDVYLDPAWDEGAAFDYTVAANGTDGNHQRDFIFHIESYGSNDLRVGATNNSRWAAFPEDPAQGNLDPNNQVPAAGWYTLQHKFQDDNGVLAVEMNLIDSSGNVVFSTTRSNASDTIGDIVGGNRYSWFTFTTVDDLAIDNHRLLIQVAIDAEMCKKGGWQTLARADGSGFKNQGDCIQYAKTGK